MEKSQNVICPACRSPRLSGRGRVLARGNFTGSTALPPSLAESFLYKCLRCNLYFQRPVPDQSELDKLYRELEPETWQYEFSKRRDWAISQDWIHAHLTAGAVLDIACWNGEFLERLGKEYSLFGIEINAKAANEARKKGIQLIADDISALNTVGEEFDMVTAFDIIEHVENPLAFLGDIVQVTREKGHVILSSGNAEAATARLLGSKYWYFSIPEHISFINPAWCRYAAEKLGLRIVHSEKFAHAGEMKPWRFLEEMIHNLLYLSPALYARLKKMKNFHKEPDLESMPYPMPWSSSRDHLLIIFQKN